MMNMKGLNESFGYTMIDSQCNIIFYLKSSLALLSGFAVSILTGKRMFILWLRFPMFIQLIAAIWICLIFLMVVIQSQQAKSHSFLKGNQVVDYLIIFFLRLETWPDTTVWLIYSCNRHDFWVGCRVPTDTRSCPIGLAGQMPLFQATFNQATRHERSEIANQYSNAGWDHQCSYLKYSLNTYLATCS